MDFWRRHLSSWTKRRTAVCILFLLTVAAVGAFVIASTRPSVPVRIPDVRAPWSGMFRADFHFVPSGSLRVLVQGQLDGLAVLRISGQDYPLPSGPVDRLLLVSEYWRNVCHIDYEPGTVQSGDLVLRVEIDSSSPVRPLPSTEPLGDYKGRWTTWYPDGKHQYSQGAWYDGRRTGRWTYWDEKGTVIRTENWGNRTDQPTQLDPGTLGQELKSQRTP